MATRSLSSINSVYCLAMSGENTKLKCGENYRALLLLLLAVVRRRQRRRTSRLHMRKYMLCTHAHLSIFIHTHTCTYIYMYVHICVHMCWPFCFGQNHSNKRAWNWPTNETLREQRAQYGNVGEEERARKRERQTASGRMTTMSLLPAAAHKNLLLKYFSQKVRLKIMHIHTCIHTNTHTAMYIQTYTCVCM